jgi:hypothetical protein
MTGFASSSVLFAAWRLEGLGGWGAVLWGLMALVGAAFLFWTYHGIFVRSGRRPLTWWLFGLRCVGVLLLVLMLARPTWTRQREEVEPGRVAVVVDTSRSMSLPDGTSGSTRYARALKAVEELKREFGKKTGDGRLEIDLFDVTGAPIAELPREPTTDYTDLTRALRQSMGRMRSRPLAGVVLISDGADNSGRPNFVDWEDTGVAVHTVGFAHAVEFDLAVREPQAEKRVIVQNEVVVQVPVAKKGKAAVDATVTLRRGREVLATKEVKFPEGDRDETEEVVSLTYRPEQPGTFELTAEVTSHAGEKDVSNNAVNFPMEVVKDPIRVLYVEGFLRTEFTFLVRHFGEKDPDVTLIADARRKSEGEKQLRDGVLDEKTLEKADVVILGDMEGDYLSQAQTRALSKWLEGKNHSLLVLGGYASFAPGGFRTNKDLSDALPVVFAEGAAEPQAEKAFVLKLTDKGQAHPIFVVSADKVRNGKLWDESPPLDGMPIVARARPAADVLAVNPTVEVDGKPAVAVAVQRAAGGGQVMVVCPDTTWHWSRRPRILGQDDTLYSRFWSQAIRWLAGRATEDARAMISVRTQQPTYEVKRKVTVQLLRQRRPGADLAGSRFAVEITDPKGKAVPGLEPRVDSAEPDVATVEFYPGVAGRYEISASLKAADGKLVANQTSEVRVRGSDLELSAGEPRPDNLRAIAAATGGAYVDVDRAAEIAPQIRRIERRSSRTARTEFWNQPALFFCFLAAVTGEWLLRRRNRLV